MIEWESLERLGKFIALPEWRALFADLQTSHPKLVTTAGIDQLSVYSYWREQLPRASAIQSRKHTETGLPYWVYQFKLLIAITREIQTSVDEDYVYGILGLAIRFFPRDKTHLLQINASDSAPDVFTWGCKFLVSYGYLEFPSMVKDGSENRTPDLPSWVADWASGGTFLGVSAYIYGAAGPICNPPK